MVLVHHVLPVLGSVRLDRMTIPHLEDFVTAMQRKTYGPRQQPYSNATINTCLQLVRKILKHAWRRRVLTDYPLREKLPLLSEPVVQNELTIDERENFLSAFDNDAGLRAHFTATALAKPHRKHQPPKPVRTFVTYAFERFAWSKPLFILALYTAPRALADRAARAQSTRHLPQAHRDERVRVLTPEGRPYSESTIKRYFNIAKAIAGITRRFRFHDQRHTFASKGINSFTLRDLLGHTSTRTTERDARPSTKALDAVIRALA